MTEFAKVSMLVIALLFGGHSQIPLKTEANQNIDAYFDNNILAIAKKGKIKEIDYEIGTPIQTILLEKGKPDTTGIMGGSEYYTYGHVIYFVSMGHDHVTSIEVTFPDKSLPSLQEVQAMLDKEKTIEKSELDQRMFLVFELEKYTLYIESTNEHAQVDTLFLKRE